MESGEFRTGSASDGKVANWLTRNQAQDLVNAASKTDLRGRRDGAILGLLLGCGLRRSEVVGLTLDQLQMREGRWVIVDLIGKGRRLRTVPVPSWSKQLLDAWLQHSGVSDGRVFRRVSKVGKRQEAGVTANVVWYAVKRCARQAGIANLAPHDLRRTCARLCHDCSGELEQIRFLLGHASVQTTERYIGSKQKLQDAVNDRFEISVCKREGLKGSPPLAPRAKLTVAFFIIHNSGWQATTGFGGTFSKLAFPQTTAWRFRV